MSFADRISAFGGMLGLFTGFSVVGLVDLAFWLWGGLSAGLSAAAGGGGGGGGGGGRGRRRIFI